MSNSAHSDNWNDVSSRGARLSRKIGDIKGIVDITPQPDRSARHNRELPPQTDTRSAWQKQADSWTTEPKARWTCCGTLHTFSGTADPKLAFAKHRQFVHDDLKELQEIARHGDRPVL